MEIRVDRWGIAHIYAETEHDLFFAQGWNAARDRLFQLELWRRQATGTVAEILGPREIQRDVGTRLFKFRGDLEQELSHYHPHGVQIVGAYVDGINAYIARANRRPGAPPARVPAPRDPAAGVDAGGGDLTPPGAAGQHRSGARDRAGRGRRSGAEAVKRLRGLRARRSRCCTLDPAIDGEALSQDILGVYNAFRGRVRFRPEDIVAEHRGDADAFASLERAAEAAAYAPEYDPADDVGSNNWVVSGRLSESGYPIMANDPHRAQGAPSLRYWVHLVAPGWNVIGGGEPSLPGRLHRPQRARRLGTHGVRHRRRGPLRLRDQPLQPERVPVPGRAGSPCTVIHERIPVKGQTADGRRRSSTRATGPVVFEDEARHRAYAVRAAWMEPGGAPYLASLRMDQATTWEEFREACNYSNIPGENMVWAGRDGTIGWQAVGIAPIRRNFSGLVPVPGRRALRVGRLPAHQGQAARVNPDAGLLRHGEQRPHPARLPVHGRRGVRVVGPVPVDAHLRGARERPARIDGGHDAAPDRRAGDPRAPARAPPGGPARVGRAGRAGAHDAPRLGPRHAQGLAGRGDLRGLGGSSCGAWCRRRSCRRARASALSLHKAIETIMVPPGELGPDPLEARDRILLDGLVGRRGEPHGEAGRRTWAGGRGGRPKYHHATLHHPLGDAVDAATRARLEVGPLPRGGYGYTVNATGNADNQTSGASFRIIVDTGDWDRAVGLNTPGQSGDPDDPALPRPVRELGERPLLPGGLLAAAGGGGDRPRRCRRTVEAGPGDGGGPVGDRAGRVLAAPPATPRLLRAEHPHRVDAARAPRRHQGRQHAP